MPKPFSDVGLIGLAVMGQNLALNIADHGFQISVFNRTTEKTEKFVAENPDTPGGLVGTKTLQEFVQSLSKPRKIIMLVQAGAATDAVIDSLVPLLEAGDIIIDGGNAKWTDTIRREKALREKGLRFIGSRRFRRRNGRPLRPGAHARRRCRCLQGTGAGLECDRRQGRRQDRPAAPRRRAGQPVVGGVPCATYIGPDGAGHYVKMIHNGIEYGDMQMICEAYALMRGLLGLKAAEIGAVFAEWNRGALDSYLIEITADILQQKDPGHEKERLRRRRPRHRRPEGHRQVDRRQRPRHGRARADDRRGRVRPLPFRDQGGAGRRLQDPQGPGEEDTRVARRPSSRPSTTPSTARRSAPTPRDSSSCARRRRNTAGSSTSATIAQIWRGGCIIRAAFLQKITEAYAPRTRPGEPAPRPVLQQDGQEGAGELAQGGGARRRVRRPGADLQLGLALLRRLPLRAPAGQPAPGPARLFSAPTPTSASTSRGGSSSTSTGPSPPGRRSKCDL